MCTWITEQIEVSGRARGLPEWITVTKANVFYDHPVSAPYEHALLIDFVDPSSGVGARIGVELSAKSAKELVRAIEAALTSPEAIRDLAEQTSAV